MIRELHIYDFDGTIFKSPAPPLGYEGDWWQDPSSLSGPCVPLRPGGEWYIPKTLAAIQQSTARPDVYTIVMTGRREHFRPRVSRILANAGVRPNELILKWGGSTEAYKVKEMLYLLKQFPNVHTVVFWEDRMHHLKNFQRAAEKTGYRFIPRYVKPQERICPFSAEEIVTHRVASRWMAYK